MAKYKQIDEAPSFDTERLSGTNFSWDKIQNASFDDLARIKNSELATRLRSYVVQRSDLSSLISSVNRNLVVAFASLSDKYDEDGFSEKGEVYALVQNFTSCEKSFKVQSTGKSVLFYLIKDYFDRCSGNQLSRWNEGMEYQRLSFPKLYEIVAVIREWGQNMPERNELQTVAMELKLHCDEIARITILEEETIEGIRKLSLRLEGLEDLRKMVEMKRDNLL
jgi:hypothetical protein